MRSPYRTRQLARVVICAALLAISQSFLRADIIRMTATFTGGILGTGSFSTDGSCVVCTDGSGLSSFSFSVLDASFNDADAFAGGFTFFRQLGKISSHTMPDGLTGDHIVFNATGFKTFSALWFDLDGGALPKSSNNGHLAEVPEPSSLFLLILPFTALAITARLRGHRSTRQCSIRVRRVAGCD
jgi:hypothetical protein